MKKNIPSSKFQVPSSKFGFSIIEVMAAITIISIGMIGVLSLVNQNIQVANANQKELLAAQLAREGLELVRNQRDNNWIDKTDWKLGAGAGTPSDILQDGTDVQDGTYTIDYVNGITDGTTDIDSINDAGAILKINSSGFYEHGSGTATQFSRLITVAKDAGYDYYLKVECTVQWQDRGGVKSYVASTVLYDWR